MIKKKNNLLYKKKAETSLKELLIIVLVSCSMLIIVNFYTIKTLSATRAYVNAESHYSKGHNKAVRNLITYLFTSNEVYLQKFNKSMSVPQGAETARIALQRNLDIAIIKAGFRAGKNDEADENDLIWLFKNFQSVPFFKKAVIEWEKADALNRKLVLLGKYLYKQKRNDLLDEKSKLEILKNISDLDKEITINQNSFSKSFGDGTRKVKDYLIIINIFFIIIMISAISFYYSSLIKKLLQSKQILSAQKEQLKISIKDLEETKKRLTTEIVQHTKIIGTISHDIKSPLKYIQLIALHLSNDTEKNSDTVAHKYAISIYKSSSQLYEFTETLIQYSKIYFQERDFIQEPYSVHKLVESKKVFFEEIAKNNKAVIINHANEHLISNINMTIVSIIIHNLVDNAVKHTNNGTIEIGAKFEGQDIIYWVKDTGIGMNQDIIDYYTNLSNNESSEKLYLSSYGIGLNLVLELLAILKGEIFFSSIAHRGTIVKIKLKVT